MPRPAYRLRPVDASPGQPGIGGARGAPVGQPGPCRIITGTPAQGGAETRQRRCCCGETFRDLPQEPQGESPWAGPRMRHDAGRWERLRQKAPGGPQGTEVDGKAAPRRRAAAAQDFRAVAGGKCPLRRQCLRAGVGGPAEGRAAASRPGCLLRRQRAWGQQGVDASAG